VADRAVPECAASVGFIERIGLAVAKGIVLVSHIKQLRHEGKPLDGDHPDWVQLAYLSGRHDHDNDLAWIAAAGARAGD